MPVGMFTGDGLRRYLELTDDDHSHAVHFRNGVVDVGADDLTCECGSPIDLPKTKAAVFLACNKVLHGGVTRCRAC